MLSTIQFWVSLTASCVIFYAVQNPIFQSWYLSTIIDYEDKYNGFKQYGLKFKCNMIENSSKFVKIMEFETWRSLSDKFREEILNKLFINILWSHDTKIHELSRKKELNVINILKDKNYDLNYETDITQ